MAMGEEEKGKGMGDEAEMVLVVEQGELNSEADRLRLRAIVADLDQAIGGDACWIGFLLRSGKKNMGMLLWMDVFVMAWLNWYGMGIGRDGASGRGGNSYGAGSTSAPREGDAT